MALPSLRQLSYLIALERTGSFSQAAEETHVTQSTLSAGIKELESITGCTLVDRSTRHARLTPAGEEIAAYAAHMLDEAEKLMTRARQMSKPMSGPLRIGVIPTIAPYLLPRILTPLQESFPDLEPQLQEDLTDRLLDKIRKGLLDTALMAFPYETPDMETLILFDEPFLLACRANDVQRPAPLKPADLEDEPLLLLEDGHCLRDHALQSCRLQESAARKTFSAASLPTLIQMVAHGYGSTLLPEMAAQEGIPETIRLIPFKNPKPSRQIGLVWRKGAAQAHNVKILAKRIQELL